MSETIAAMDTNKAVGTDGINAKTLKLAGDIPTPSLTALFNRSINSGVFPDMWKVDKISPIHKTGDVTNPGNYRPVLDPVAVLPAVSVMLEYCMGVKTATDPSGRE